MTVDVQQASPTLPFWGYLVLAPHGYSISTQVTKGSQPLDLPLDHHQITVNGTHLIECLQDLHKRFRCRTNIVNRIHDLL